MDDKQRKKLYKQMVARLPGTWEDQVTPLKRIRDQDLLLLAEAPARRFNGEDALEYEHARDQECHALAAHAWLSNPGWQLVFGFAAQESMCSADWHLHSFCLNESGQVVEPTPLYRQDYWGVVLPEAQALAYVAEEVENITRLGFELTPAMQARLNA